MVRPGSFQPVKGSRLLVEEDLGVIDIFDSNKFSIKYLH